MERFLEKNNSEPENMSIALGKSVPFSDASPQPMPSALAQAGFEELAELADALKSETKRAKVYSRLPKHFRQDQLEMLEAELNNQGLLSRSIRTNYSLSQHIQYEANVWKWRAERVGFEGSRLHFCVDLPTYIISRAEELLSSAEQKSDAGESSLRASAWQKRFESQDALSSELRYLESFAAFLNGAHDNPQNGYQRGLNLVLRVICSSRSSVDEKFEISLPINKSAFFSQLKEID